jgi:hypothetical protein
MGHTGVIIDVDKELFLWSVINRRRDFALLFWSRGKNKICKYDNIDLSMVINVLIRCGIDCDIIVSKTW